MFLFNISCCGCEELRKKDADSAMHVFTHHHHDMRSDAWRHASGRLIFYGHEPRLSGNRDFLCFMTYIVKVKGNFEPTSYFTQVLVQKGNHS